MVLRRSGCLACWFVTIIVIVTMGPARATDLFDAVKTGNVDRVEALLHSGADPHQGSPYDGPLHLAARLGSLEIVADLVAARADIELAGYGGIHPLHAATLAGQPQVVSFLLEHGAKVDALDNTGRTPLLSYVSGDVPNIDTLKILLEAGADPNRPDGPTQLYALGYAASHGRADVVDILIAFGADVNARDSVYGETALHNTIAKCWERVTGHADVARLLLNRGADINARDSRGLTPLDYAKLYAPNNMLFQDLLVNAGAI